jgi:predicted N-acetyltransferase YhbS
MEITIRRARPEDADACARIILDAFRNVAKQHNFPDDFPHDEVANHMSAGMIADPRFYSVVAEIDGKVVGSNFLDERDAIRGVGPITVDPDVQCKGVGRKLMDTVIERGKGAVGIRLIQEAYNRTSLSLYTALGFDVIEPVVIISGKLSGSISSGATQRPMEASDLDECAALCKRVHGFDRINELTDNLQRMRPFVVRRSGKLTAYCGAANFYLLNHGVAETEQDMRDLLLGAGNELKTDIAFLLPTRQSSLFRWCLSQRMRIVKPLNLMAMGEYHAPRGCFFPSISY